MTMLSRVFGLLRDMLVTAVFGASLWNSAFTTAFTLPSLFRRLLGEGALTAALMPNLSEELAEHGRDAVYRLVNKTLSWLFVVCVALIGLAYVSFEIIERVSVSDNWILAAGLAKLLFPYVLLICLAAVISAALNLFNRFAIPAMTAVWLNCSILLTLGVGGWLWGDDAREKMYFLCAGVLLGGTLQLLAPMAALMREGWKPRVDFSASPRLKAVLFLTLPGIYGTASHQINVMISRGLALDFNESGAALINLANRLVELPLGVFTIAISTVIFPSMSKAIAEGRSGHFGNTYRKGVGLSMMMALPATVGLSLLAPEIISTLFQRAAFSEADTNALVPILIICAIGMPFYSFVSIEVRAFYALKDTTTPVKASTIGLAVNLVLSLTLLRLLDRVEALMIASNTAIALQAVYLHFALKSSGNALQLRMIGPSVLRFLIGSGLMAGAVWLGKAGLDQFDLGSWRAIVSLLVLIPLGGLVYLMFLWILRTSEIDEMMAILRKKWGKSGE